ncbi:MAG: CotY/CotZ family spore coat protein [Bacillota bacterium]
MDKELNRAEADCIFHALYELKRLQDYINELHSPFLGKLLSKLIGVDTIPFYLYDKDGRIEFFGTETRKKDGLKECFLTSFFRIEKLEESSNCATISLLRPLNIHGEDTNDPCDVVKLKKTSECVQIDLSCICAIQCLDAELLKREIIIEPKW